MKVARNCPICLVQYDADAHRLKHGRQTTCSRACSYKARAASLRNRVALACSVCGAEFSRAPSRIKAKYEGTYCSRACHYTGRSAGLSRRVCIAPYVMKPQIPGAKEKAGQRAWATRQRNGTDRHTEATRIKLRHATSRAISLGKFKRVSRIEEVVAKELRILGVDFIAQWGVRDGVTGRYVACVDFYLPAQNVALEVNGTFWHCDPRFYDPVYPSPAQRRTIQRYAAKVAHLCDLGIQLAEVWEYDLRQNPKEAVERVLRCLVR